jgi:hypothetical protein
LSLVVKKWYPNYEYAQSAWHIKQSCSLWYKKPKLKVSSLFWYDSKLW